MEAPTSDLVSRGSSICMECEQKVDGGENWSDARTRLRTHSRAHTRPSGLETADPSGFGANPRVPMGRPR